MNKPARDDSYYFLISSLFVFLILILSAFNLHSYLENTRTVDLVSNPNLSYEYWKEITTKYPSYAPGYEELSREALKRGDASVAISAYQKLEELSFNK